MKHLFMLMLLVVCLSIFGFCLSQLNNCVIAEISLTENSSTVDHIIPDRDAEVLIGEWAFDYDDKTVVLRLSADGTAWYQSVDYTWEDQDGFLVLTKADGDSIRLRYAVTDEKTVIYPQTSYHRGKNVEGQGGLIGIWEGISDGSSFVFTPAGYFLEDNAFSGNFIVNPDEGTFLLHYGDVFTDTLCYFTLDHEILTVEYPWSIIPVNAA